MKPATLLSRCFLSRERQVVHFRVAPANREREKGCRVVFLYLGAMCRMQWSILCELLDSPVGADRPASLYGVLSLPFWTISLPPRHAQSAESEGPERLPCLPGGKLLKFKGRLLQILETLRETSCCSTKVVRSRCCILYK